MLYCTEYESPVGRLMVASDGESLIGLWLEGQKYFLEPLSESPVRRDELEIFFKVRSWLDRYFGAQRPDIGELPLRPGGGDFRREIWKCLCEIPYGEVTTYGAIAKRLAERLGRQSMSAQAVGGAVGHNPISIIIPCHRVIGANGSLTGYAGGIERKLWLLRHEGALDK